MKDGTTHTKFIIYGQTPLKQCVTCHKPNQPQYLVSHPSGLLQRPDCPPLIRRLSSIQPLALQGSDRRSSAVEWCGRKAAGNTAAQDGLKRNNDVFQASGLNFMGKHTDTVFLADLHMPEMDGFALLDRMENTCRTMRERLHIFVLSPAAGPDEIWRVLSYRQVIGFLSKRFSKDKMKQIMDCIQFSLLPCRLFVLASASYTVLNPISVRGSEMNPSLRSRVYCCSEKNRAAF